MKELSFNPATITPAALLPGNRPDNEGSGGGSQNDPPLIGSGAVVGGKLIGTDFDHNA